jgi:hypothetical protein
MEISSKCNGVDRVPSRATWPPPWLSAPEEVQTAAPEASASTDAKAIPAKEDPADGLFARPDPGICAKPKESSYTHESGDNRAIFALLPNGHVVRAKSLNNLSKAATWWCREGDKKWRPVNTNSPAADCGPPPPGEMFLPWIGDGQTRPTE